MRYKENLTLKSFLKKIKMTTKKYGLEVLSVI